MFNGLIVAATAFNLTCTGNQMTGTIRDGLLEDQTYGKFETVYRIDLEKMRWCEGECSSTSPIANTTDYLLTLDDRDDDLGKFSILINREVGIYSRVTVSGGIMTADTGRCERADFSGFPVRKF